MNPRIIATFFAAVLLAGCSFSASTGSLREERSKIADLASQSLAETVGREPEQLDCGDGKVDVVEGDVVDCTLTDGGTSYAVTVTFTEVDGKDYKILAEVADEPAE